MKSNWSALLLLNLCMLAACDDSDNTSEPPPISVQEQCLPILLHNTTTSDVSRDFFTRYRYNTSGQLDRIVKDGNGVLFSVDIIEYEGGVIHKIESFRDSLLQSKISTREYTYLPNGQIKEVITFSVNNSSPRYTNITLDAQSRIVLQKDSTSTTSIDGFVFSSVTYLKYEYGASGNLAKVYVAYNPVGSVEEELSIVQEYLDYDEALNPNPPTLQFMGRNFSRNNPLRVRFYDSEGLIVQENELAYTYNASNYPVGIVRIIRNQNGLITGSGREELTLRCE
jgi:hypothetical protein